MGKASVSAKRIARLAILCAVLAQSVLSTLWVLAQEGTRYYEETGHNVSGEFPFLVPGTNNFLMNRTGGSQHYLVILNRARYA